MNSQAFQSIFDETVATAYQLLVVKGGEYAGNEDRLGNFKRGSQRVGIHPLQILWIYAAKHIDSIETFIRDEAGGVERLRSEAIEGRFDDLINYCILAKALIAEAGKSKPKVVAGGDSRFDGDRPGSQHSADLLGAAAPFPLIPDRGTISGDGADVHRSFGRERILVEAPVQLASRKIPLTETAAIVSKAGGEKCLDCFHKGESSFAWPCNICVSGSRFTRPAS